MATILTTTYASAVNLAVKSRGAKRQASAIGGDIKHTKKPDLSNVIKGIKDAMNKIVDHDDARVVELVVRKGWVRPQ